MTLCDKSAFVSDDGELPNIDGLLDWIRNKKTKQ